MSDAELPVTGSAQVYVVHEGYVREIGDTEHVGGTTTAFMPGPATPR